MSFDAFPHAAWPDAVAAFACPWPRALAAHDLRYHAAEHAVYRRPLPSERDLAGRWGWSRSAVTRLLGSGEWADMAREWRWREPAANQRRTSRGPTENQADIVKRREVAESEPATNQPWANGEPAVGLTRDLSLTHHPITHHPSPSETEKEPPALAGCSPTLEPEPMPQATPEPEGPRMPAWVPGAKATAPHDRRDVAAMVVRCIKAVRGTMPNPDRCGTDAGPLLSLWRKVGKPPPEAFAAEFRSLAEWAALSRDPGAAHDIRAEGWDGGKDRSRDIATLCRQDRWGDRSTAAQAWEDAGRAEAKPAAQAAFVLAPTPSQARRRATIDALDRAMINLSNQTTPEVLRALS